MYSIFLIAALSGSAETPACPPQGVIYYALIYYGPPCVYYVDPWSGQAWMPQNGDGGLGNNSADNSADNSDTAADKLTPAEEAEFQDYLKDVPANDRATMQKASVKTKRSFIKQIRDAHKKGKGDKGDSDKKNKGDRDNESAVPVQLATILVELPADARLTVDEQRTTSTSASRRFISPPLKVGAEYYYTLQMEMMRDGEVVRQSKRITVRAGQETRVTFADAPVIGVAQK